MSDVHHRGGDEALPVAVAALLAGALASRKLGAVEWPVWPGPRVLAVSVGLVLLSCAALALRVLVTRRGLRSRVRLAVVPADELDPSLEAVMRLAAQLSRARRGVRGWLDKRASAIRVRLASDRAGRLTYVIEAPSRAQELVRAALRGLDGVALRQPADPAAGNEPRQAVRAELVLARPSVEPLARLDLDPDPLQPIAAALTTLRPQEGDRAVVCVDLLPATPGERRRLHRSLLRQARSRQPSAELASWLSQPSRQGRTPPAELAERRAEGRALDAKLKDAGPLFRLQLLIRCEATDPARAKATLQSLLGGFDQLADRNWLRPVGLAIPGLAFLGSDLPGRRRWLDRRLRSGLFWPGRSSVVSAREIAGLLKPPTVRCKAPNVLRGGPLVPAPPRLPEFDGQAELIPLGRVDGEQGGRLVGVRVADSFFSYVAGRSRYGKTELAVAQFVHLVRAGHGGMFLDPHEDAVARIKRHLTDAGVRERVVEINLAARRGRERQPGWNLFELSSVEPGDAEARVEAVVDAFASALGWDERNNRAITLTTQAAQALAQLARSLPPELAPTIFQLPTLLSDDDWRSACLPLLPAASQRFWRERFPRLSDEAITPVTNLIDRLRASTATTALLGQSQSSYRIRQAMDCGQIVLACPGSGGARDRLVANLLVFDLLHAAKAGAELAPERRRPFFVFLDEVQTYDGAASGNLAALLEQTAKYGIRAFLLNQNPERLTAQTLNAVTTNRSHLLATALNARAAGLIAKEWGGQPDPAALTKLPRYRFLCQVTHRGEPTQPFPLAGVTVEQLLDEGRPDQVDALERAIDQTAGRRPTEDTLAQLDTLDERIHQAILHGAGVVNCSSGPRREPTRAGGLAIAPRWGRR